MVINDKASALRIKFRTGKRLEPGEVSSTGIYAVCSNLPRQRGKVLRLSLIREAAALFINDEYRYLAEAEVVEYAPIAQG